MLNAQREKFRELRSLATTLVERLERPLKFSREFKDSLGIALRHSGPIPGQAFSFQESLLEARRVAQRLRRVRFSQHTLIQASTLDQSVKHLANLNSRVPTVAALADQIDSESRDLQIVDGSRIHLRENGEPLADFADPLIYIYQQVEALKGYLPQLDSNPTAPSDATDHVADETLALDRAEVSRTASEVSKKAKSVDRSIEAAERQLSQILERSKADLDASNSARASITEALNAITGLRSDLEERRAAIEAAQSSSEKALAVAQERVEEIGRSSASAQAKNGEIDALLNKVGNAAKEQERIAAAAAENEAAAKSVLAEIESTVGRANDMLRVSTVAGLASSFNQEKENLEGGMKLAGFFFVVSIILLFATSGILASYVLEIPLNIGFMVVENSGQTPERGDEADFGGVAARAIILLAPFWAALFSARRYNALFDLRQHYSHKYNIAFAVDGFQKQAPEYKEILAAMAFRDLLANPVDHAKSRKMGEAPMTAMAEFLKPLTDQMAEIKNMTQGRKE